MRIRHWLSAIAALLVLAPSVVSAQTPMRFSAHTGLGAPIGRLGDNADLGFNLGLRGEVAMNPKWDFRGDASWERFGRQNVSGSYSYWALAGNLVHRQSARFYQYGGVGVYRTEVSSGNVSVTDANLGLQGGVGLNTTADQLKTFVEFGLTGVFTSSGNNWWFPVKVGIRF